LADDHGCLPDPFATVDPAQCTERDMHPGSIALAAAMVTYTQPAPNANKLSNTAIFPRRNAISTNIQTPKTKKPKPNPLSLLNSAYTHLSVSNEKQTRISQQLKNILCSLIHQWRR
jgi:hypothetical protein